MSEYVYDTSTEPSRPSRAMVPSSLRTIRAAAEQLPCATTQTHVPTWVAVTYLASQRYHTYMIYMGVCVCVRVGRTQNSAPAPLMECLIYNICSWSPSQCETIRGQPHTYTHIACGAVSIELLCACMCVSVCARMCVQVCVIIIMSAVHFEGDQTSERTQTPHQTTPHHTYHKCCPRDRFVHVRAHTESRFLSVSAVHASQPAPRRARLCKFTKS